MNIFKKINLCLVTALLIASSGNASEEKIQKFNMVQAYCIKQSRKRLLIDKQIRKLALSPDGKSIVFCEGNLFNKILTLTACDTQVGSLKYNLVGHEGFITSIMFSPDGKWIVSTSTGNKNNLIVWNALDGTQTHNLTGHSEFVNSAKFSPDGKWIVSFSRGHHNNLIVWNVLDGTQKHNLVGHSCLHPCSINSAEFSPDGALIVSGSNGSQDNLIVWNVSDGTCRFNLVGYSDDVLSVKFSLDGRRIVSYYDRDKNNFVVFSALSGALELNLLGDKGNFSSYAYNPNGKWIMGVGMPWFKYYSTNNIFVWNASDGILKYNLTGYPSVFSPDGTHIITGSYVLPKNNKNNLTVWNALDGKMKYNLKGHYNEINLIMFSLNGNIMISASKQDLFRSARSFLWDARPLKWNINDFSDGQIDFLYALYMKKKENKFCASLIKNNSEATIYNSFSNETKEIIKQAFNILDSNRSWFSLDDLVNSAFGKKVYELYKFLFFK